MYQGFKRLQNWNPPFQQVVGLYKIETLAWSTLQVAIKLEPCGVFFFMKPCDAAGSERSSMRNAHGGKERMNKHEQILRSNIIQVDPTHIDWFISQYGRLFFPAFFPATRASEGEKRCLLSLTGPWMSLKGWPSIKLGFC